VTLRRVAVILALIGPLTGVSAPIEAQRPVVELGFRVAGAVTLTSDDGPSESNVAVGGGAVSAAHYLSERVALEPSITFISFTTDVTTVSALTASLALPINFRGDWGRSGGVFVAPEVGARRSSQGDNSSSQYFVGAALGVKVRAVENLLWRLQGNVDRYLEDAVFPAATELRASFGIAAYF
jgi:hypothetical protein